MLARRPNRRGAAVVESALVLGIFMMMLFGLFEYSRFLMVMHITNNAARDGARYAVAHVTYPTNFDTTAYTDPSGTSYPGVVSPVYPSIQSYVQQRMGGVDQNIQGFQVAVYPVDPVGMALSPPVLRSKTTSNANPVIYPNPFNQSDSNRVPWNQASFSDRIAVTINGTYQPITPVLLFMPSTISINITAIMGSEG